jgi:hypothetical protein
MNIDDDTDIDGNHGNDYSPAVDEIDLFGAAIALCQVAQRAKTVEAALKRLRKVGRDILVAEKRLAVIEGQAAEMQTALTARAAALAAGERALTERTDAFEASCKDVRDELREYHNHLEQMHRALAHRLLSLNGISWNEDLQAPPSWQQLRQMIADLPPDPPALAPEVVTQEVTTDWTGNHSFIGTLTRSVPPS